MKIQFPKSRASGLLLTGLGLVGIWSALSACRAQLSPEPTAMLSIADPADDLEGADALHAALYVDGKFPTAAQCGECHPKHFAEWSVSPHAYAQLSPVFNAMQATVTKLTNGANGDFCIRCHSPVGMALGEPIYTENKNRAQASVEGVTCIVCHRVNGDYGKISGRFKLETGDIHAPVYGPSNGSELERILTENKRGEESYADLKVAADQPGDYPIHAELKSSFFLTQSGICGSCHDVTSPGGFRLEEAFSEYKSSPAAKNGVSCQDCHMGTDEGKVSGREVVPAAILPNGQQSRPREVSSHFFAGPDYSIVHPGMFPVLSKVQTDTLDASLTEWHDFDLSWGSAEFEADVPAGTDFRHEIWESARNRKQAHEIIYGPNGQIAKLEIYRDRQLDVLREGYQLGKVEVSKTGAGGIDFRIEAKNGTDGHNVPTGFIAERTLYIEVTVFDGNDNPVFTSGDLDPNGDVRDAHSVYVHNGAMPLDKYLFSLQSKFIIRLFRGGEREQVLAVNHSADPLPFPRPTPAPVIATGRPPGARTHRVGLPPNGSRWADYSVKAEELTGVGPYTAKVRMIAGMVPINLVHEIRHVGFDYGMNPRQIGDRVVEGRPLLWEGEFSLSNKGAVQVEWDKPAKGTIDWWQVPGTPVTADLEAPAAHSGEAGQ